ncbi:Adenosine 5'-monophosphoramidase [Lobosporangium transversale]|uniref:Hnt1 cyclin dependent kinase Kin28 interacting protein n=1 Tax=Lobosporangium transversale TaxID=64571 RepID=A0A1Y2GV89_9FUNG|nr:Hnt1 cyclin dependent kinase Kin28 interacting protein [Lobosporangium transversale]KAF9918407.1 Adenosine 5'-monophosphoramidase [Lobosporangium transversale]ORZ22882.1 Hnt1 cyclin dependent kinase Kin28 interacting protein [Lobosporangium transversale]|eukprot:XP_021883436.1 Hnt1 cyclin dependent kinase Kin28 interacting protein [Lobosporangium transversale]
MASNAACIFCRIIKREIPAKVLFETEHSLAFLDIGPLSEGHTVVIPKYHAQFLHELPDSEMVDLLPTAKKVAQAIGCKDYNILQNNGRIAHQAVDHVHFHVIPKPSEDEGLTMDWKTKETNNEKLEALRKTYLKL